MAASSITRRLSKLRGPAIGMRNSCIRWPISNRKPAEPKITNIFQQGSVLSRAVEIVFTDEVLGIVCYHSPTGELVCEGRDEGPYFVPPSCTRLLAQTAIKSNVHEVAVMPILKENCDLWTIEYMGSLFCEGRDEG